MVSEGDNDRTPIRVLLIEDDFDFAELLSIQLGLTPIQVTHRESLGAGIAVLASEQFDAVLLDLSLPDSSGVQGVQPLIETQPSVPIIIMTGCADDGLAQAALQAGAQDYLVKGKIGPDSIARAIRYSIQRKRFEQQLKESREQQRAAEQRLALLEQREEFIATLAHDLKTPIFGVRRVLQLMIDGAAGEFTDKQRELLLKLVNSSNNVLGLVENLLQSYRLDEGCGVDDSEPLDLLDFLQECSNEISPLAEGQSIKLTVEVLGDLPKVQAAPLALKRVFCNLLSNAIKFTPKGGTITVTAFEADGHACVNIVDTGCGISEEDKEHLFTRFWQGRSRRAGTGLGLYVSKQLMEAIDGSVECTDTSPGGTTFAVKVPLAAEDRLQILVVDDSDTNGVVLKKLLERLSVSADIARSGSQALEMAKSKSYAAYFVDIMMPDMDGFETSKGLRALSGEAPIFGYSAIFTPSEIKQKEGSCFEGLLSKPINLQQLHLLVETVFAQQSKGGSGSR